MTQFIHFPAAVGDSMSIIIGGLNGQPLSSNGATVSSDILYLQTFTSGYPGLVPLSGGGIANYLRADGAFTNPLANAFSSNSITNLGLLVTKVGNDIVIDIRSKDGHAIDATHPVGMSFRNSDLTVGQFEHPYIPSALGLTITGAVTLGVSDGVSTYIYLYAFYSSSVYTLGASLNYVDEGALQSSSTNGTSSAVIYQPVALTTCPIRIIGRIKAVNNAGVWDAPTEVALQPFTIP